MYDNNTAHHQQQTNVFRICFKRKSKQLKKKKKKKKQWVVLVMEATVVVAVDIVHTHVRITLIPTTRMAAEGGAVVMAAAA